MSLDTSSERSTLSLRELARSRALRLLDERDRLEEQRERYSNSLRAYTEACWHVIQPSHVFIQNWHLDAIAEHLEAVTFGQIKNLLINMPPRCMKSLMVCVFWMTWVWTFRASATWFYASYSDDLSQRDHRYCRRIFESSWYQDRWGHNFQIQLANQRWLDNDQGGHRLATTVAGWGTGEGGDYRVVDDPHNVEQALSDQKRVQALRWWDETMAMRFNEPGHTGRVIVMQRLHEGDLSGHVLERGGYEHLMLPMEFEADRRCRTSIGWQDPREHEGELLWPKRFNAELVAEAKLDLKTYGTAGQLQQRPAPRGGGFFQESWLRWYDAEPKHVHKYGASDYATGAEEGDYTVHGVFGVDPEDNLYVLDWWREITDAEKWIEVLLDLMVKHKPMAWAEPREQARRYLNPIIRKRMRERKVYCIRRDISEAGDKPSKARAIQARMEAGKVYFPQSAPWKDDLINELLTFPAGVHDDQVDVLSLMGRMLDRLVPGRVPPKKPELEVRPPTLDELLKLQPKRDGEDYRRI